MKHCSCQIRLHFNVVCLMQISECQLRSQSGGPRLEWPAADAQHTRRGGVALLRLELWQHSDNI